MLPTQAKWMTIVGWVMSSLMAILFGAGGVYKITQPSGVLEEFQKIGFPDGTALIIGIVEVTCALIYLVPQTAVLGAILLTGYMGGAICVHVRAGESIVFHIIIGVLIWLGIFLREPRLRAILPLR